MYWYIEVVRKYAEFSGRARRKEYWMFFLINFLFSIAAMTIDIWLGLTSRYFFYGDVSFLYSIVMFIPGTAVTVRRLHDTGNSGWMIFINLIPFIGIIWFLGLTLANSEPGENKYGPNPKEEHFEENQEDFIDNDYPQGSY